MTFHAVLRRVLAAEVLTPQSRNMILFSAMSGCRAGEVAGLRWHNIDWEKKVALVQCSYDGPTKSGKPRRVQLIPQVIEALESQRALGLAGEYIFPGRSGDCRKHSVLRQLKQACREVGIKRNVVAHSLRHTFCTLMLRKFNPYVVKELAGHSAIATTMRYAHAIGADVERAVLETSFEL